MIRDDNIHGVPVITRELQLTSQWAEARIDWEQDGVSYRLSYHRSEGQPPDEEMAEDVEDSFADIPAEASYAEPRKAEVDEAMRTDARKMVASIIEQAT